MYNMSISELREFCDHQKKIKSAAGTEALRSGADPSKEGYAMKAFEDLSDLCDRVDDVVSDLRDALKPGNGLEPHMVICLSEAAKTLEGNVFDG